MEADGDRVEIILRTLVELRSKAVEAGQPLLAYLIELAIVEAMEVHQPKQPPS